MIQGSSFYNLIFNSIESYFPILISASYSYTYQILISYLNKFSPLLSHSPQLKSIILIFDGFTPSHFHLIEFILYLIINKSLISYSSYHPKVSEFYSLLPFQVIVTSRSIQNFNSRFLSLFFPIQFFSLSDNSASYIAQRILTLYEISLEFIPILIQVSFAAIGEFQLSNINVLHILYPFCFLTKDIDHIQGLFSQLFAKISHPYEYILK
jgi:hypothetical protein